MNGNVVGHTVFLSHSVKDEDEKAASTVYDYLERQGIRCFMDKRDLVPGKLYPEQLATAIRESLAVVLVFSSSSDASPAVQNEMAIAANNRIPIIPLRVEDVRPRSLEFFLAACQWLDAFTSPFEQHLPKLAAAVKQHLDSQLQKDHPRSRGSTELSGVMTSQPAVRHPNVTLEEASRFFYTSTNGLNMSNSKAFSLAKLWMEQHADKDFALFKELCLLGYRMTEGLNMSSDDAVRVALRFLERYDRKDFSTFKESCLYAYRITGGLNMSGKQAAEFGFSKLSLG